MTLTDANWIDYSAQSEVTGFANPITFKQIFYKEIGNTVFVKFRLSGTSNSTALRFTVPFNNINMDACSLCYCKNNGVPQENPAKITLHAVDNTVYCYPKFNYDLWIPQNQKLVEGQFFYEKA